MHLEEAEPGRRRSQLLPGSRSGSCGGPAHTPLSRCQRDTGRGVCTDTVPPGSAPREDRRHGHMIGGCTCSGDGQQSEQENNSGRDGVRTSLLSLQTLRRTQDRFWVSRFGGRRARRRGRGRGRGRGLPGGRSPPVLVSLFGPHGGARPHLRRDHRTGVRLEDGARGPLPVQSAGRKAQPG